MSEQIGLARVDYYLAHRSIGPALVEQEFDQMIGAPMGPVATQSTEASHGINSDNRRSHGAVRQRRILGSFHSRTVPVRRTFPP